MNSAKIGVGVLTALTIAVVAYVFVGQNLINTTLGTTTEVTTVDLNPPGDGPPVVAILTQKTVATPFDLIVDGEAEDAEEQAELAKQTAGMLMSSTMDYLSGNLANSITRTGRLQVVENTRIERVLREVSDESSNGDPEAFQNANRQGTEDRSGVERLLEDLSAFLGSSSQPVDGKTTAGAADLATAAEQLGANYILVVYVTEPKYESFVRAIPDTTRHVHVLRAAPTISYRLFNGTTGTVMLADVTQQGEPLQFVYDHGTVPTASDISREFVALDQRIAQEIVTNIIDTVFPAQISLADPTNPSIVVMDRGARDGIEVDDIFEVSRSVGQVVGANNVALAEEARRIVGLVRVTRVQDTVSFVETINGGPMVRGDFIEIVGSDYDARRKMFASASNSGGNSAREIRSKAPALGIDMINAAKSDQEDMRPRIAVREVAVAYIDCVSCESIDPQKSFLPVAFLDELQNEQRIVALSRQDMEAIIQERNFADNAADRSMRMGLEGMSGAHYVLTGDATISPKTTVSTDRIAGRVVETGRSTTLTVSGMFRIIDAETTQQVKSTQVEFTLSGGASQSNLQRAASRAAELATADLMNKLFPLAVLDVVSDQQIELSGGQQAGLREGMRLQAFSVSARVDDLYGGRSEAGRSESGQIIVTDVRADRATAKFAASPFDLKRGDTLEIVSGSPTRSIAQRNNPVRTATNSPTRTNRTEPDTDNDDF